MARTDGERYKDALDFLKTVTGSLGAEVEAKTGGKKTQVGAELSLEGAGYWYSGSNDQHSAVRALLLCHIAYFRPPHAQQEFAGKYYLDLTRKECHGKSKAQVIEEIRYYEKGTNPSHKGLADAACRVNKVEGVVDRLMRTRKDVNVSGNPICYDGVVSWLFAAGFISKRWLAKEGNDMQAAKVNGYLGNGEEVDKDHWDSIPQGYIWNIHRVNDKTTCHWGVSLGDGIAVACNNTDESPTKKLEYLPSDPAGNTQYGKFRMADICEVLNGTVKYGHHGKDAPTATNIVLRKVNPLQQLSYY